MLHHWESNLDVMLSKPEVQKQGRAMVTGSAHLSCPPVSERKSRAGCLCTGFIGFV